MSNESTFTTKHLNRVPVKTEMGRVSRLGEKYTKMTLDFFCLFKEMLRISPFMRLFYLVCFP